MENVLGTMGDRGQNEYVNNFQNQGGSILRVNELFKFMHERHRIYCLRQQGKPKPWTKDPILQCYKFTNVYRELDTVTQWIAKNWRLPHQKDPNLWFAMCVARFVNWPPTLDALGYPVPWSFKNFRETMNDTVDGSKVWGGAYIVSTNGNKMNKPDYIGTKVLNPLWNDRADIQHTIDSRDMLAEVHSVLMRYDGLGSFLAAQVIADLKYVKPLCMASDWHTWAASGPGSRRGLSRVLGSDIDEPWRESVWLATLKTLHPKINALVKKADMPALHAQDLQNCLCEFDKYERTRLGEGRPRSRYQGAA